MGWFNHQPESSTIEILRIQPPNTKPFHRPLFPQVASVQARRRLKLVDIVSEEDSDDMSGG